MIASDPTATEGVIEQVGVSDTTVETTAADGDELICTKERLTGTRIPTKVCLTRSQRDRIQDEAQNNFEAERRKAGANPQN